MIIGSSVSICSTAGAALERHVELLQAGASLVDIADNGRSITLLELERLALRAPPARRPRRH